MTFHRNLHGGPVLVAPIEKISRHITAGRLDARVDMHGVLRVIDRNGTRRVLLSLPKVKGYYDEQTGSNEVEPGRKSHIDCHEGGRRNT